MVNTELTSTPLRFLSGGGVMGEHIRALNWADTAVGTPDTWPQSLCSALSICLHSGFPIAIYWGADFTLLYNDAWSSIPGDKHPWALGQPGRKVWPEIWDQLDQQFNDVLYKGSSIRSPDTLLPMERFGYTEECYFDYTLSPIYDTEGNIGGVLNAVVETTYKVINERRNFAMHRLARQAISPSSKQDASDIITREISFMPEDIPFCLVYELADGLNPPRLLTRTESAAELTDVSWPFGDLVLSDHPVHINSLASVTTHKVANYWPEVCSEALMLPLRYGTSEVKGFLVAGVSARKRLDLEYRNFLGSIAMNIDAAIARGIAQEQQQFAKLSLERSEQNLRNIILQAPVAMCIFKGPNHVLEIANDRMYELWGKPESELLGQPIFSAFPEASGQGFEAIIDKVYNTGETFSASGVPIKLPRNGTLETVYANFVYEAFREHNGTVAGILAVAVDVTEQVMAQKKIEEAEERARLAITAGDLGAFELNLQTDELIPTPRFAEIFGLTIDSPRSSYLKTLHPEDAEPRRAAYERAYQTGKLEYEARVLKMDGPECWIKVKGSVLPAEDGSPGRLVGVVQDVTEQKLFAAELNRQVVERTQELKQANEQLERSNNELEQFAYVTSHDLQEPLRKITVFSNMALRDSTTDRQREYLDKVVFSAGRMAGLIKGLLNYSRLVVGHSNFEQTDLNEIFTNILSDFELTITQKQAVIESDKLPTIEAVPLQMNQLLFNLIGNALKFSRPGIPPVITITAVPLAANEVSSIPHLREGKDYFALTVSDNGIGFDQEYADRIFGIFQRLNDQSTYSGYGIGLALCRKIVESHGGTILASGKPNLGAEFKIILPFHQS